MRRASPQYSMTCLLTLACRLLQNFKQLDVDKVDDVIFSVKNASPADAIADVNVDASMQNDDKNDASQKTSELNFSDENVSVESEAEEKIKFGILLVAS